jgi:flagellar biosynthetic protein FliP
MNNRHHPSYKWFVSVAVILATFIISSFPTLAQEVNIEFGDDMASGLTERIIQTIVLISVLSLAPSILIMVTSFVRIVIVLSLLRTAMGVQQSPPNTVMVSLALFLTAFIMGPVFETAYEEGIQPLINEEIEMADAFERGARPFHGFMMSQVREADLGLFLDMSQEAVPETPEAMPFRVLIPAFMISELRTAFEIGFLVFVPFLVIDLVVASVLMSMGMMMLPPIIISLPFKVIFFVLVDGWALIAGSLVESFSSG